MASNQRQGLDPSRSDVRAARDYLQQALSQLDQVEPSELAISGGYGCKEKNEGKKRSFWRCSIFYHLPSCGFGDYINVCS